MRELFAELTRKASAQFLNDQANDRLKSAISGSPASVTQAKEPTAQVADEPEEDAGEKVVTTEEEIEGFMIVKAIVRHAVDVKRVAIRDNQSYCGVLLDDNNRKPICRLHFNRSQKYLGVFDQEKNETRIPINSVDDIYAHSEKLIDTTKSYL